MTTNPHSAAQSEPKMISPQTTDRTPEKQEKQKPMADTAGASAQKDAKKQGVLYIGMDLGTSRTSVSASNGVRETVYSIVGYPKDVVARKLLGKDVLYGKEALEKRLSLQVYKPLEKGVLTYSDRKNTKEAEMNLKAAKDLIREAIRIAKPRKDELVYCVIGAPAQASIINKEAIIEAARASVDSVMLCSEPFSVAYGLDMLEDVLVVDIGAGTTDLCRMHGTMPEESDQITFDVAGDAIDQELSRQMTASCPGAQFSIFMVKEIKERHGFIGETGGALHRRSAGRRQADRVRPDRPDPHGLQHPRAADRRRDQEADLDVRRRVPAQAAQPRAARGRRLVHPRARHRGRAGDEEGARRRQGRAHRGADLWGGERGAEDRARHARGLLGAPQVGG
jgi:hypothetical protein